MKNMPIIEYEFPAIGTTFQIGTIWNFTTTRLDHPYHVVVNGCGIGDFKTLVDAKARMAEYVISRMIEKKKELQQQLGTIERLETQINTHEDWWEDSRVMK